MRWWNAPPASGPHEVTLQDVRTDGADPRDLGLTILKEDPAADTNTDPAKDPLFRPGADYDPWTERQTYTPDGRRIVLTRFEGERGRRIERIWIADADGTHEVALPLAGRGPGDWDTDPALSPDGKQLAFTRTSPGGVGEGAGPSRILIADVATGAITGEITPPAGQLRGQDAQPTWSADGSTLAFTRNQVIDGGGGNKHIWTVPVRDLGRQHDLSAEICPGNCRVIDDSPAFSPDGRSIAFNRKNGGGRIDERNGILLTSLSGAGCRVLLPAAARDLPDGCRRELPEATGPFQPRDAAWTADGRSSSSAPAPAGRSTAPEKLKVLDIASGEAHQAHERPPGPAQGAQRPAVRGPRRPGARHRPAADRRRLHHGPRRRREQRPRGLPRHPAHHRRAARCARHPDHPARRHLRRHRPPVRRGRGAARDDRARGRLAHRGSPPATRRSTGRSPVRSLDPRPSDNAGRTVVPVRTPPPPTPTPTPTPPSTPAPTPPPTVPPEPPAPRAGPGVRVTAQPNPGYVGGRVVVTYTVRNGRNALATGLRLRIGLPAGIPDNGPPPGCDDSWVCALPDLEPGASTVVRVVLPAPTRR